MRDEKERKKWRTPLRQTITELVEEIPVLFWIILHPWPHPFTLHPSSLIPHPSFLRCNSSAAWSKSVVSTNTSPSTSTGPVWPSGDFQVVRHQNDGQALALVEFTKEGHDLATGARIQVAGGLVAKQDRGRMIRARAMATRCCWPPESWFGLWSGGRRTRPDSGDQSATLFPFLSRAAPVVEQGHLDVFQGRRPRQRLKF